MDSPGFGSLEEELEYWKEQAARSKQRFGPALVSTPFFFNVLMATEGCFVFRDVCLL